MIFSSKFKKIGTTNPNKLHLSRGKPGSNCYRLLLIAYFDEQGLGTILENIMSIQSLSRFTVDIYNTYYRSLHFADLKIPEAISFDDYDVILIHPAVSYSIDTLYRLDADRAQKLCDSKAIKVLMKQDEQCRVNRFIDYIKTTGIDLLATCVPEGEVKKVYPREILPDLALFHTLTGYVTDHLLSISSGAWEKRPIEIGYRGSQQPLEFGNLCRDKYMIGEIFREKGTACGLKCDISSRLEDRFFGEAWFRFLGSCKAVLGVESGSNVFDFTGEIEERTKAFMRANPEAEYDMLFEHVIKPFEGNVIYSQISPRHFESAACKAVQILYDGEYSNIFIADRHFIPLKKDWSNFEEVVERLRDTGECKRLVDNAYREIICNPEYSYRTWIARLDDKMESLLK